MWRVFDKCGKRAGGARLAIGLGENLVEWRPHLCKQHTARILNVLFDLYQELYCFSSVEHAVVVCKGKIHHLHHCQRVEKIDISTLCITYRSDLNFAINCHGSFLCGMHSEDCGLRKINDGGAHH